MLFKFHNQNLLSNEYLVISVNVNVYNLAEFEWNIIITILLPQTDHGTALVY